MSWLLLRLLYIFMSVLDYETNSKVVTSRLWGWQYKLNKEARYILKMY